MKVTFIILLFISTTTFSQANKGWQQLFDGKTLNGWTKKDGTAEYKVENGAIVGITTPGSPNTFLVSSVRVLSIAR